MVLCPGAPEGSTAVVLILKRLRRWGHGLVSSKRLGKVGFKPATPGLQGVGLSPSPFISENATMGQSIGTFLGVSVHLPC